MFKSNQTKILGITSLLAAASGVLFYLFKGEAYKSGSFLLYAGMPLAINLYTVHCVITGKCTLYSWLLTVVLTVYAAGIFLLYAKLLIKNKEVSDIVQAKTREANSLQNTIESSLGF